MKMARGADPLTCAEVRLARKGSAANTLADACVSNVIRICKIVPQRH